MLFLIFFIHLGNKQYLKFQDIFHYCLFISDFALLEK